MIDPSRRILLIDAESERRARVAADLRAAGFGVDEAEADAAADAMLSQPHEVVIVDAGVMHRGESSLYSRLMERTGGARTMILALEDGSESDVTRALVLERGADACLSYPVDKVELTATISALLRCRDEVAQVVRQQQEIIAAVGHDLRSPLGTVNLVLELLERAEGIGERERGFLAKMKRSSQQIQRLSQQLLQLHRAVGADPAGADKTLMELGSTIEQAIATCGVPERPIHLENPDRTLRVIGNPMALTSLVANLIAYGLRRRTGELGIHVMRQGSSMCIILGGRESPMVDDAVETPYSSLADSIQVARFDISLFVVERIACAMGGSISRLRRPEGEMAIVVRLPAVGRPGAD